MKQYYEQNTLKEKDAAHNITMESRRQLEISGVRQIESFDSEEFLLETMMGFMSVKGYQLQMKTFDVEKGVVIIKGKIFEIVYLDDDYGDKAKGFLQKLFR